MRGVEVAELPMHRALEQLDLGQ
ncbi:MAG: hypothetical protein RLZZ300_2615, partial [Pseudomonadota bacterium]